MQKIKFSRTELKNRAATALLTAAPLSVMLLSAIYNLAFGSFGYDITSGIPVLLSCLTVIALIAGTVLAAVYKKRFPAVFFALLFLMCFICYACFCASGTTDIYADGFFEALMLILSVPVWSYMPLAAAITSQTAAPAMIITGVITLSNAGVALWLTLSGRKENNV